MHVILPTVYFQVIAMVALTLAEPLRLLETIH